MYTTHLPNTEGWFDTLLVSLASLPDFCSVSLLLVIPHLSMLIPSSSSYLDVAISEIDRGNVRTVLLNAGPTVLTSFVFALQSLLPFAVVSVLVHTISGKDGIGSYVSLDIRWQYPSRTLATLPLAYFEL